MPALNELLAIKDITPCAFDSNADLLEKLQALRDNVMFQEFLGLVFDKAVELQSQLLKPVKEEDREEHNWKLAKSEAYYDILTMLDREIMEKSSDK